MAALAADRALTNTSDNLAKTYERLASGNRISHAADDAAGLAISENLRSQIRSMRQAERNANDGVSFVQVAEGGLNEMSNILIRLRELAIQAGSDTVGDKERGYINTEAQTLVQEVDRIANSTQFNGVPLLNGSAKKDVLDFQVGIRNDEADRIKFNVAENDSRASKLGIDGLDYTDIDSARNNLDKIDSAMGQVFASRSRLGAMQNRLQSTVNNDEIMNENLSGARSRISDVDIATETSELVRGNILQSAGIAVLAQANQAPMNALKLL
jgi:flagellin